MKEKPNHTETINVDEALGKSEAFILKNKTSIMAAIVAVIVIVGGSILYTKFVSEPKEKEAAEAIFAAENSFGQQAFEVALNGDEKGNLGFLQIIDQYSGTPSGNIAKAYAGMSLSQLGRYAEAIPFLKDFNGDDQMVAPAVLGTLGNCYAQTGDQSAAVKYFLQAADKADNVTISPYYLLQAGLIYENEKKNDEALKVYTKIKEKYFNSLQAMDIDKYINRVK